MPKTLVGRGLETYCRHLSFKEETGFDQAYPILSTQLQFAWEYR
jgi:hypothetical protein